MLSFLLMQLCIYAFVRPIGGRRVAIPAAALPLALHLFNYGLEIRPYTLLLAMAMAALVRVIQSTVPAAIRSTTDSGKSIASALW